MWDRGAKGTATSSQLSVFLVSCTEDRERLLCSKLPLTMPTLGDLLKNESSHCA